MFKKFIKQYVQKTPLVPTYTSDLLTPLQAQG